MKRLRILPFLLLLLACKKDIDPSKRIPADASAVMQINMPAVSKKLLTDKITGLDFLNGLDLFIDDQADTAKKEELIQLLENPSLFGADVFSRIYGCRINEEGVNYWTLLFLLEDPAALEKKMEEKFSATLRQNNGFSYHMLDNKYVLAWQKEEAFLIIPEAPVTAQDQLKILTAFIPGKTSKPAGEIRNVLKSEADISFWAKDFPAYPGIPSGDILARLIFEEGSVKFISDVSLPSYRDYLSLFSENKNNQEFEGDLPFFTSFNINLSRLALVDSSISAIRRAGLTPKLYAEAFSGKAAAFVSGAKTIAREYVSLEPDENFELVEKKVVCMDTVPSWTLALEVKNKAAAGQVLKNLQKQGLLGYESGTYSTTVPADGKVLFSENFLLLTNSQDRPDIRTIRQLVNSGSPLIMEADIPSLFALSGKYSSQISGLKQGFSGDPVRTVSLKIHDLREGKFKCTLLVELKEKDRNALIQILDYLKKSGAPAKSDTAVNVPAPEISSKPKVKEPKL